jgi:hypothetical protein
MTDNARRVSHNRVVRLLAVSALLLVTSACGDGRKPTYPVRAEVYVDGKPAHELQVYFHPAEGAEKGGRSLYGMTNEQGVVSMNTYVAGDGVPAGEYIVTFEWCERGKGFQQANFTGPDRLKGKYANLKDSKFRVTVEKKPKELDRFELTTGK